MKSSLKELQQEIGADVREVDPNMPHPTLRALVLELGKDPIKINYLLQYHKHRDCDGNWSELLLKSGYITVLSYKLTDPVSFLETRYTREIVAPHAVDFFKTFITEAIY